MTVLSTSDTPTDDTPKLVWEASEWAEGVREFANLGSMSFAIRPSGVVSGPAVAGAVTLSLTFDDSNVEFISQALFDSADEAKAEAEIVVRDFCTW